MVQTGSYAMNTSSVEMIGFLVQIGLLHQNRNFVAQFGGER